MTPRSPWLTTTIGPSEWAVWLADAEDIAAELGLVDEKSAAEGCTICQASTILVSRALPRTRRADVLIHELLHAVLYVASAHETLRLTPQKEEAIVSTIAPGLTQALAAARVLRLRRPPRAA